MILELIIGLTIGLLIIIVLQVLMKFYQQHEMNKYFTKVSPKLPIANELISVYGGHARSVLLNKRNCFVVDELHKKLGKTYGIYYGRKPMVSTIDLDLIKAVVLDEPYKNINRSKIDVPLKEIEVDSIATSEDEQWRRLRQSAAPAFTNHRIKSSPKVRADISSTIDEFVQSIEKRIDDNKEKEKRTSIDLDSEDMFHRFVLDIIFKCFYKQENLIDFNGKIDKWSNSIEKAIRGTVYSIWNLCTIFPIFKPLLIWYVDNFKIQGLVRKTVQSFIKEQTKSNFDARNELKIAKLEAEKNNEKFDPDNFLLKDGTKFQRNLIDYFIDQFHDKKLSESEYLNTGAFLFYAADKTSTDAITLLAYQLALHQEVQEKLRQSIVKEGEESEYLMWCINESLRLYPPAPVGCSRSLSHDYTTKDGIFLPKGTVLLTCAYSIHRSAEIWGQDVLEFKPERWSKSKDFHPCQFIAFGLGKRNCIGKAFAQYKMKMLVIALLKKFKLEKSPLSSDKNLFESPGFVYMNFDSPHYIQVSRI